MKNKKNTPTLLKTIHKRGRIFMFKLQNQQHQQLNQSKKNETIEFLLTRLIHKASLALKIFL